jgi:hypothetical protein
VDQCIPNLRGDNVDCYSYCYDSTITQEADCTGFTAEGREVRKGRKGGGRRMMRQARRREKDEEGRKEGDEEMQGRKEYDG